MKDLQPAGIYSGENNWIGVQDIGGGSGNIEGGSGAITPDWDL